MKAKTEKHIPVGVWLIASFYVLGALVLLVASLARTSNARQVVAAAHGLPPTIGVEVVLAISALAFLLAYGLVSLSRWGFFLAAGYSLFLCAVSLLSGALSFAWTGQPQLQVPFGNLLWSAAVLIYLFAVRKRFFAGGHTDPAS